LPLFGTKAAPGLFSATASAKQAAQRCKEEGLLRIVRTEPRGKSVQEICALTEKGLAHLLSQVSPKQVLEDFVRALESRQIQVGELVAAARNWEAGLDALRLTAERILQQLHSNGPNKGTPPLVHGNGADTWMADLVQHLAQWRAAGASEDCPLPDLFR